MLAPRPEGAARETAREVAMVTKADRQAADARIRPDRKSLQTSAQSQPKDRPTDWGGCGGPKPNESLAPMKQTLTVAQESDETRSQSSDVQNVTHNSLARKESSKRQLRGKDTQRMPRVKGHRCQDYLTETLK